MIHFRENFSKQKTRHTMKLKIHIFSPPCVSFTYLLLTQDVPTQSLEISLRGAIDFDLREKQTSLSNPIDRIDIGLIEQSTRRPIEHEIKETSK